MVGLHRYREKPTEPLLFPGPFHRLDLFRDLLFEIIDSAIFVVLASVFTGALRLLFWPELGCELDHVSLTDIRTHS